MRGILSVEVSGSRDEAMAVAAAMQIFTRATSLGGNHSLIEHRASVEGRSTMASDSLLRLSNARSRHPDTIHRR